MLTMLCATFVEAQSGAAFRQRWTLRTQLPDGGISTMVLGANVGDVAMGSGTWRCKYSAPSPDLHDVVRAIVCNDGVGTATVVTTCADNAAAHDLQVLSLGRMNDAARQQTMLSLACRTEPATP
jgi:hypothetical protein